MAAERLVANHEYYPGVLQGEEGLEKQEKHSQESVKLKWIFG